MRTVASSFQKNSEIILYKNAKLNFISFAFLFTILHSNAQYIRRLEFLVVYFFVFSITFAFL